MTHFYEKWIARRNKLRSCLCVGFDPEWEKIPDHLHLEKDPTLSFAKEILPALMSYATAWKPNVAFFERFGSKGFASLEKTIDLMRELENSIPILMDAKRGDIGNTAKEYAKYYFEEIKIDAITLHPYMGWDSIAPYLDLGGFAFVLCLTSNPSHRDLQRLPSGNSLLFEKTIELVLEWERRYPRQLGIVVGATHPEEIIKLRSMAPNLLFLLPGVGAQGADLLETYKLSGKNSLLNVTRALTLLAKSKENLELCVRNAKQMHQVMQDHF